MNIKLRFQSIIPIEVGDYVDTIWGNDHIELEVLEILEMGGKFKLWAVRANIVACWMNYYEK